MVKLKSLLLLLCLSTLTSCLPEPEVREANVTTTSSDNIVQLAVKTNDLSSLVAVIQYVDANGTQDDNSDLAVILSSNNNYTVFAPTNAAFAKLDQNSDGVFNKSDLVILEGALGNSEAVANALYLVVANHALSGKVVSDDLTNNMNVITIAESVTRNSGNFGLTVFLSAGVDVVPSYTPTEADVITANIMASNGVVHLIDTVLLDDSTAAALGLASD
jgi:transforming growth factor-beta-induced protein